MQHLINEPIEAHELQSSHRYEKGDHLRLSFWYHKGLAVGHDVEVAIEGSRAVGTVILCKMEGTNLFKVDVAFFDSREAFKVRNAEQVALIKKIAIDRGCSLEQAAQIWANDFASTFPKE